ncbi:MAG: hypothetical protein JWM17_3114 [Actinobacteria bacterium]|nr:hypothetical protein [Actinomycetota bacterium]
MTYRLSGPSYERIVQGLRVGRDWDLGEQDRSRSERQQWLREALWAEPSDGCRGPDMQPLGCATGSASAGGGQVVARARRVAQAPPHLGPHCGNGGCGRRRWPSP